VQNASQQHVETQLPDRDGVGRVAKNRHHTGVRDDEVESAEFGESAICGGGVAIVQGDVGYGMLAATPDAARRTVS
jgi:hypothetical protein